MNVLILNWRDIKNPLSGGAEILTHEIAKGLVKRGSNVVVFSSFFKGAEKREIINGVEIIRDGHPDARHFFSSVQYKAYKYYKEYFENKIDVVVDEIHGVPFFTPFYVKEKKVALICEVAGQLWDVAVSFPFNIIGKNLEKIYPIFYKNIPIITISDSSKKEMIEIGFPKSNIGIIPMGCSVPIVNKLPKKNFRPTLIFIARLSRGKGAEDAIEAIKFVKKSIPNIMLWILGRGPSEYITLLEDKIKRLKLENSIKLMGFTSEKDKINMLTKSHILVVPSVKEGWGLTVHEAGARATPSIVYNIGGLRNAVKGGINGIICEKNTPLELSNRIIKMFHDKRFYSSLQKGAIAERKKHGWNATVKEFLKYIQNENTNF